MRPRAAAVSGQPRGRGGWGGRGRRSGRGARRGRVHLAFQQRVGAAHDDLGVRVPVDVQLGDRPHPVRAPAGRIGETVHARLGQVPVVALDIAADGFPYLRLRTVGGGLVEQPLHHPVVLDPLEVQIAVEVGGGVLVLAGARPAVRPQVAGALGVDHEIGVGQGADVVPCRGVAVTRSQPLPVGGDDVRDAVLGVADRRPVRPLSGGGRPRGRRRAGEHRRAQHGHRGQERHRQSRPGSPSSLS